MRITHYSFGKITVDGKTYTADLIIHPDRVEPSWWRRQGHVLEPDDLRELLRRPPEALPEVLVVGTGHDGVMEVPRETIEAVRKKGIELHVAKTAEAVSLFNGFMGKKRVVAALHLTC